MTTYSVFVIMKTGRVFNVLWKDEEASIKSFTKWVKEKDLVSKVYRHSHTDGASGVLCDAYEEA